MLFFYIIRKQDGRFSRYRDVQKGHEKVIDLSRWEKVGSHLRMEAICVGQSDRIRAIEPVRAGPEATPAKQNLPRPSFTITLTMSLVVAVTHIQQVDNRMIAS